MGTSYKPRPTFMLDFGGGGLLESRIGMPLVHIPRPQDVGAIRRTDAGRGRRRPRRLSDSLRHQRGWLLHHQTPCSPAWLNEGGGGGILIKLESSLLPLSHFVISVQ